MPEATLERWREYSAAELARLIHRSRHWVSKQLEHVPGAVKSEGGRWSCYGEAWMDYRKAQGQ